MKNVDFDLVVNCGIFSRALYSKYVTIQVGTEGQRHKGANAQRKYEPVLFEQR